MSFRLVALALALVVAACASGEDGGDCDPIAATLVERIEVSPASTTLTPGQTTTLTARAFSCAGALSPVTFTWESGNTAIATVSAAGVVTGVAPGGPVQVTARAQGKAATASVTVGVVPVATVTVTPGTAALGVGRTAQLTARAFDASGTEITGRTATWSSANETVATVNASGVVTGVTAGGPVAITATVDGVAGSSQVTVSLVPVATVTVDPANSTIASSQTVQLSATARDAEGNILVGRAIAWASENSAVAPVSETGLVTGQRAGGPVTITATSEGQSGSAGVTVTVGAATRLAYIQQPTDVQAGSAIAPAIVVEAQDAGGNRVTTFSGVVILALQANPGGSTLGGMASVSAAGGRATFSTVSLNRPAEGYTLLASSSGLTSVTSSAFAVAPGAPDHVVFLVQPSDTRTGSAISPAVQVEVRDALDNRVTTFTSAVTVSLEDNPGGATLGGTTTVAAGSGVAQFADLTLDRPASGYTLRTGTAMLAAVVSAPFTVAAGEATSMRVTESPVGSVTSGQAFTVTIEALDASGNRAVAHAGTVTLTLNNGATGATLSGITTRDFAAGVATFPGLSVDLASAGYAILATSDGLENTATLTFDVMAGPAQALRFSVAPSSIEEGDPFPGPIQVQVVDAVGNQVPTATNLVTVTVRSSTGGAAPSGVTLGGDGTQNAVAGLAQFPGLTVNLSALIGSAQTIRLRAAAAGFTNLLSDTFVVTPD